ncbi:hypothetical protein HGA91_01975 [candidate division WWE3 bacterium]|nr:hypothetical protein [candidate division WWE3 bacterium]
MMSRFMTRHERISLFLSIVILMAGISVALLYSPYPKMYRIMSNPNKVYAFNRDAMSSIQLKDKNHDNVINVFDLSLSIN